MRSFGPRVLAGRCAARAPAIDQLSSPAAFGVGAPAGATTRVRFLRAGAFVSSAADAEVADAPASPAVSVTPSVDAGLDTEPVSPATFVNGAADDDGALRSTGCRVTGAPALEPARRRGRFVCADVEADVTFAETSDVDAPPCVGLLLDAVSVLELAGAAEFDGAASATSDDAPDGD